MKTYQDLKELGANERDRMDFLRTVINQHKSSRLYKTCIDAQLYYDGENPTINRYEKILYDMAGRAHVDMFTANHKIASRFFGIAIDQECSYLLGNGVSFSGDLTKERLGADFDQEFMDAARAALIGGVSFVFFNQDHIETFSVDEFAPLFDEENGSLRAGVRWWQVDSSKPLRCTLYEEDGYTEYIQRSGEEMQMMDAKRPYRVHVESNMLETQIMDGEPYDGFPVVPFWNSSHKSELIGRRNTLDALDLARSSMVNNVDEGNLIYWVLKNSAGMDDLDDAEFIRRVKTMRIVHTEDGGSDAEPHTIEAPFNGTQTTIDMLIKALYEDFQAFDASAVSAGNQTATAIKASYVPLDLKTDKFEAEATRCILAILRLAGIDDKPTYTRSKIINASEEVQTVLLAAQYLDEEYITKKVLTLLGDADQYEEMMARKADEELGRLISTTAPAATPAVEDPAATDQAV